jgi:glycosyltransferase involved in cell wall biosynthesis
VHFTGAVPHTSVPGHLAACDVLAAPYEPMEGFYFSPLKIAEYLQIGCPVLASAVGGIPQLAAGARQVTLVAPGDTDALAGAIASRARHAAAVSAAEPAACSPWTWDDVVRRVLEAGEQARRERWNWSSEPVPAVSRIAGPVLAAPAGAPAIGVNAASGEDG